MGLPKKVMAGRPVGEKLEWKTKSKMVLDDLEKVLRKNRLRESRE